MNKVLLAACGIVLLAFPPTASAQWLKVQSDAFILYAAGDEQTLVSVANDLNRYDTALRQDYSVVTIANQTPLTIYMVNNAKDVGRLASGTNDSNIAGWYSRNADGSFAISNLKGWSADAKSASRSVLLHEYMHHFLHRHRAEAMPAWLSEGTAEFYSTMMFDAAGRAIIGQFPQIRAKSMAKKNQLPIETLLFSSPLQIHNKLHQEQFYNRAWLLTHMMNFDAKWKPRLAQYLLALNSGTDDRQAAADAFGDFKALNIALDQYGKRPLQSRTVEVAVGNPNLSVQSLTSTQSQLLTFEMERKAAGRNVARLAAVHTNLCHMAADQGHDADVQFAYAKAGETLRSARNNRGEDIAFIRSQTQDALRKALIIRENDGPSNLLHGQMMMEDLRNSGSTDIVAWKKVRVVIQSAIQANPQDPMALKAYYDSFIGERRPASTDAVKAIAKAFEMVPELPTVRIAYAWSLARGGDLDGAQHAVQVLANDPQDRGHSGMTTVQLVGMRRLQNNKTLTAPVEG